MSGALPHSTVCDVQGYITQGISHLSKPKFNFVRDSYENRRSWKNNIEMCLQEVGWGGISLMDLV
jgi:hypothetical protein